MNQIFLRKKLQFPQSKISPFSAFELTSLFCQKAVDCVRINGAVQEVSTDETTFALSSTVTNKKAKTKVEVRHFVDKKKFYGSSEIEVNTAPGSPPTTVGLPPLDCIARAAGHKF